MVDELQVGEGARDEADGSNDDGEDTIDTPNSFDGRYPKVWMVQVEDHGTRGDNVDPLPVAPNQPQVDETLDVSTTSHGRRLYLGYW